jgi:hypothetical protein
MALKFVEIILEVVHDFKLFSPSFACHSFCQKFVQKGDLKWKNEPFNKVLREAKLTEIKGDIPVQALQSQSFMSKYSTYLCFRTLALSKIASIILCKNWELGEIRIF